MATHSLEDRIMTLTDVLRSLPASRDLIESGVNALRPAPHRSIVGHFGTLGLGLAIGAGIALLCAPKSGRDLRRQLSSRLDGVAERLNEAEVSLGQP